jgi:regulatory protein
LKIDPASADLAQAYAAALRILARRDHSRAEMLQRLTRKGFAANIVDAVLAKLAAQDLLNDLKYACSWVAARVRTAPRSRRLLALELRRKGIDDATAQRALADLDDFLLALACIQRRARQWQGIDERPAQRLKILRHLQNKGFAPALSRAAVRRYLADQEPGGGVCVDGDADLDF